MTCCIKGCEKKVLARGMCAMHYRRTKLYGDPTVVKVKQVHGATLQQRWDAYVQRSDGCWLWSGFRDPNGYGRLNIGNKPVLAHRISWELHCEAIAPEQHVLHRCDNPTCVRPDHLFLGDHRENMADMNRKGRGNPGHVQGEAHGGAKLTAEQVIEIRSSTDSPESIGKRYSVSRRQVRDIRAKRVWRRI